VEPPPLLLGIIFKACIEAHSLGLVGYLYDMAFGGVFYWFIDEV
jgi:hypothetical protein